MLWHRNEVTMHEATPSLIDINHMMFSSGNDFVDFVDTNDICGEIAAAPFRPANGHAVLCLRPPIYYSLSQGIADNRRINDRLLDIAARSEDRVFGVAEPKYGAATREEIQRIAGLGAAGVVWSPRAQGVFADDLHMAELCAFVAGLGMISMIHSAPYSINESLARVWNLATKCPSAHLVVLGAFASWENVQTIQHSRGGPANLLYDISGAAATRDIEATIAALGADRLLLGSGGGRYLHETCDLIARCTIDEEARQAILSSNSARLLQLGSA
jgi:predicted TIM-barrel fold metal-dependent hydrolase